MRIIIKKPFAILVLIIIMSHLSIGQTSFQRIIGGNLHDQVYSFVDSGIGYVIAGSTNSSGAGGDDILIIQTDYNYNILGAFTLGGPSNDFPRQIISCQDGGYAILGSTYSYGAGDEDLLFVKLDQSLAVSWASTYGGWDTDRGFCLIEDNNEFIFGGTSYSSNGALIIKTDNVGGIIWSNTYGFDASSTRCFSGLKRSNGNYLFTGPFKQGPSSFDYMTIEVDGSGALIKATALNAAGNDHSRDLVEIDGDGIYIMGHSTSFGNGTQDLMLTKLDLNGNFLWAKNYSYPYDLYASELLITSANQILLSGHVGASSGSLENILLLNCDMNGNLIWSKQYGDIRSEINMFGSHNTLQEILPGEFLSMGQTASFGASGYDIFILGFDDGGSTECNYSDINLNATDVVLTNQSQAIPQITFAPLVTQPNLQINQINLHDSIICPVTELPIASFIADDTVICVSECIGFSDLSLNQPTSWEWQFEGGQPGNSTLQDPAYICYPDPGCFDVRLIVTNISGTDTLVMPDYICVNDEPDINLGNDTLICPGTNYNLDAGFGYASYLWQDGSQGQSYTVSEAGMYHVTVTTNLDCQGSDTIIITEKTVPEIYLGKDTIVCGNFNIVLDAGAGFDSYLWQDGSHGSTYLASLPGIYYVEAELDYCLQHDTIRIEENCPSNMIFPNCFTPNGDGLNDYFAPLYDNIARFKLLIFNRWGQKLFESEQVDQGWDGKYKGNDCPGGVYFFLAEFIEGYNNEARTITGAVSLIR